MTLILRNDKVHYTSNSLVQIKHLQYLQLVLNFEIDIH